MATQEFENAEYQNLAKLIYDKTGIVLDGSKKYLIESRIGPLLEEFGLRTYQSLADAAQRDAHTLNRLIDEISTNETLFFRDSSPFELLKYRLIPELMDKLTGTGQPIRIWSAGAATGQEVYSIAIACFEVIGSGAADAVNIVATDISENAVKLASSGIYSSMEIDRGLNPEFRDRYFTARDRRWQIRDEIRAMASFRQANLLDDLRILGSFDIIFCRNVAIYFDKETRQDLFQRIARQLKPGGALILGASENLIGISDGYERQEHMRCPYYTLTN